MGDDQAGLIVAERLRESQIPGTEVFGVEAPGSGLLEEPLDAVRLLVIIDAARADQRHPTGTSQRLEYREQPAILSPNTRCQTHGLGVDTGLELAASLGLLPDHVWIFVVFGRRFERCAVLSDEVATGIGPLTDRVERDILGWLAAAGPPSMR